MSRRRERLQDVSCYIEDPHSLPPFLPSLAVRRPVLLDDGLAESTHKLLKKEMKFHGSKVHGYLVAPDELCLVVVEQQALIKQMREAGIRPEGSNGQQELADKVKNLAFSIELGLSRQLQNTETSLNLPLDGLKRFQSGKTLGMGPQGWKGYNARYSDQESPNAILTGEKQFCLGAIATTFPATQKNDAINVDSLIGEPHIALLNRGNYLADKRFIRIAEALSESLPETLELGDPIVYIQSQQGEAPLARTLWPRQMIGGRLKLVA